MSEADAEAPKKPRAVPRRKQAGPTDISDPLVRQEARKAFIWLGMASLFALVVVLANPLLVIFGGMVFAAMIDGGARLLGRVLAPARNLFAELSTPEDAPEMTRFNSVVSPYKVFNTR